MIVYDNCGLYIESRSSIREKIAAIDAVISLLFQQMLTAATSENINEYQLNDGQTIIKQVFNGTKQITAAIQALRIMRQDYINQINGRVFRGVDSKNFRTKYGNQF